MKVAASKPEGGYATTAKTTMKEADGTLSVPFAQIDTAESISLGFRQEFCVLTDEDGNGGRVLSTAGWGAASLILEYKNGKDKRQMRVNATDLLIEWVATFAPDEATKMREAVERFYK